MACTSAWEMCILWQTLMWWSSASSTRWGSSQAFTGLELAITAWQTTTGSSRQQPFTGIHHMALGRLCYASLVV